MSADHFAELIVGRANDAPFDADRSPVERERAHDPEPSRAADILGLNGELDTTDVRNAGADKATQPDLSLGVGGDADLSEERVVFEGTSLSCHHERGGYVARASGESERSKEIMDDHTEAKPGDRSPAHTKVEGARATAQ